MRPASGLLSFKPRKAAWTEPAYSGWPAGRRIIELRRVNVDGNGIVERHGISLLRLSFLLQSGAVEDLNLMTLHTNQAIPPESRQVSGNHLTHRPQP